MSPCIKFAGPGGIVRGIVTVGGPTIRIETNQGVVGFEWHNYFGPMPVSLKRGHVGMERVIPVRHDFWRCIERWQRGGMVVRNGWAVLPQEVAP